MKLLENFNNLSSSRHLHITPTKMAHDTCFKLQQDYYLVHHLLSCMSMLNIFKMHWITTMYRYLIYTYFQGDLWFMSGMSKVQKRFLSCLHKSMLNNLAKNSQRLSRSQRMSTLWWDSCIIKLHGVSQSKYSSHYANLLRLTYYQNPMCTSKLTCSITFVRTW